MSDIRGNIGIFGAPKTVINNVTDTLLLVLLLNGDMLLRKMQFRT